MLQSLSIENYALIEHLEFQPEKGLTVITGETGAGKSIIMGALGLILGQRADAKAVRTGKTKCVIEAAFDVSGYDLASFFDENELEYDAANTIVRREIYATGKSRAFINDSPVQLSQLKQLGEALIDIHSQHQNLLISEGSFQMEVIDTLADNQALREEYHTGYKAMTALRRQLEALRQAADKGSQEADYMRFQFKQLDDAQLVSGEFEELEQEQDILSHAEEIKGSMTLMAECLDGDDNSILSILKHVKDEAQSLRSIYPVIDEMAERLESDYIDLKDMARDISSQSDDVTFDPERLAFVEDRISSLMSLMKRYDCQDVDELISLRDSIDEQLQHIDNSEEEILEAEQKLTEATSALTATAARLTDSRQKAALSFQKELAAKVAYLGMPNVRFEASITPLKDFAPDGLDEVTFLFSANKNQPLKPAGTVASGGEISRLMLSIKALIASAKTLPTIIFDEIDTGVSGDIADRMGEVMKQMSAHLQVITITHLPQVAGKGDAHFVVYKEDSATDTTTHINQLGCDERIHEIARMLSGARITDAAIENAKALLNQT